MASENYKDPENVVEIIEEIKECPTLGDIMALIERVFPGWIVGLCPGYSDDYAFMNVSWDDVCAKTGVEKRELIIVRYISEKPGYRLTAMFSELLTRVGFCVRQKNEYFACEVCSKALPQQALFDALKKGMFPVPDRWSTICSTC